MPGGHIRDVYPAFHGETIAVRAHVETRRCRHVHEAVRVIEQLERLTYFARAKGHTTFQNGIVASHAVRAIAFTGPPGCYARRHRHAVAAATIATTRHG